MVPLWIPWTAVIALGATAWFASCEHKRDDPERSPNLLVLSRIWAATLVVLVAATWVTVDRFHVSEDELLVATRAAAAQLDGTVGGFPDERLEVLTEDRLGHGVRVNPLEPGADDSDRQFEVRPGDDNEDDEDDTTGRPCASTRPVAIRRGRRPSRSRSTPARADPAARHAQSAP